MCMGDPSSKCQSGKRSKLQNAGDTMLMRDHIQNAASTMHMKDLNFKTLHMPGAPNSARKREKYFKETGKMQHVLCFLLRATCFDVFGRQDLRRNVQKGAE